MMEKRYWESQLILMLKNYSRIKEDNRFEEDYLAHSLDFFDCVIKLRFKRHKDTENQRYH